MTDQECRKWLLTFTIDTINMLERQSNDWSIQIGRLKKQLEYAEMNKRHTEDKLSSLQTLLIYIDKKEDEK